MREQYIQVQFDGRGKYYMYLAPDYIEVGDTVLVQVNQAEKEVKVVSTSNPRNSQKVISRIIRKV